MLTVCFLSHIVKHPFHTESNKSSIYSIQKNHIDIQATLRFTIIKNLIGRNELRCWQLIARKIKQKLVWKNLFEY